MIAAVGLVKEYESGGTFRAVDGVSLTIARGELVLIIGPNGSGKTTLLSMLGGLVRPTRGVIRVAGRALGELTERELERFRLTSVGFVFQTFRLLDTLTARENVELVIELAGGNDVRSRAEAALARTGALHLADRKTKALSGGEKQRIAIARALANDPPIVLADEPTGSLDAEAGESAIALLHAAAREDGRAVVIVSHDTRIERHADRVLRMADGAIVDGSDR